MDARNPNVFYGNVQLDLVPMVHIGCTSFLSSLVPSVNGLVIMKVNPCSFFSALASELKNCVGLSL